jgi:hypothetical protein
MFPRALVIGIVLAALLGSLVHTVQGAGREHAYVVRPADTLWSIAVRTYAGDPRQGVWEIERRNGLHGALLRPGQRLVLP